MTIWRMRIACWMPKAINTHSQHVIPTGFPLHQWLQERVSVLRFTYIACLATHKFANNEKRHKMPEEQDVYFGLTKFK